MRNSAVIAGRYKTFYLISALIMVVALADCGGGSPPPPPPPVSPTPTSAAVLTGTMQVATGGAYPAFTYTSAADASMVFSCGCSAQAGTATTSNTGQFTLVANSTPTPSAPDPIYTIVPGRNYVTVASDGAGSTPPEAWDIQFAGRTQSRNLHLNGSATSDVYTAAVALYVFWDSASTDTAYDDWNFNALVAWHNALVVSPNAKEMTLLNDIAAQSATLQTLFPNSPKWNPSQATNPIIRGDLGAVKISGDAALPTPCPSAACTGTPTP